MSAHTLDDEKGGDGLCRSNRLLTCPHSVAPSSCAKSLCTVRHPFQQNTLPALTPSQHSLRWKHDFDTNRCRAPSTMLLRPYADRARRAARRYPPASLAKSLVLGQPLPDVGFRDFVASRASSCSSRTGERKGKYGDTGSTMNRVSGTDGIHRRGAGNGRGKRLPSGGELVRECRSMWMEYCYGC